MFKDSSQNALEARIECQINFLIFHPRTCAASNTDLDSTGHTKADAIQGVPWFRQRFQANGVSVMKDHWIEIRHGAQRCFAQIEDCGPYRTDDANYVFKNERSLPHPNNAPHSMLDLLFTK